MEHPFTWFSLLGPSGERSPHVYAAILVLLLLTAAAIVVRRHLAHLEDVKTSDRVTIPTLFEMILEAVLGLMRDIIGPHAPRFLPLIGTLALFIFFSNILGVFPGFTPPTQSWNTTLACALIVFVAYHYFGVREHGVKYIKHFIGPIWWLAPLMMPIELISHFVRILSLSVRLMGNINGDHIVVGIFLALPALVGIAAPSLLVPIPMMLLGILVAVIQTFVFSLLSMVYISLAVEHEEHA